MSLISYLCESSSLWPFWPNFPKITSQISFLLIGREYLHKVFGHTFGKARLLIGCWKSADELSISKSGQKIDDNHASLERVPAIFGKGLERQEVKRGEGRGGSGRTKSAEGRVDDDVIKKFKNKNKKMKKWKIKKWKIKKWKNKK